MKTKYSKNQVRAAGEVLACASSTSEECQRAYAVVTYWRTAHDNPMRAMSDILEALAKEREDVVVASRLKRIDTIIGKLKRPGCTHKLNSMNDIAGCRMIANWEFATLCAPTPSLLPWTKVRGILPMGIFSWKPILIISG